MGNLGTLAHTNFDVLGPYLIALLMGIGSMCVYVWGVMAGAFGNGDDAALRFYRVEMDNDKARRDEPGD